MERENRCNGKLADGGDDGDGVEQCSGERPLQLGVLVVVTHVSPVPAVQLDLFDHLALELAEDDADFPREVLAAGRL